MFGYSVMCVQISVREAKSWSLSILQSTASNSSSYSFLNTMNIYNMLIGYQTFCETEHRQDINVDVIHILVPVQTYTWTEASTYTCKLLCDVMHFEYL